MENYFHEYFNIIDDGMRAINTEVLLSISKKIKEVNSHGGDIHFHLLLEEKPVCKGEDGRCTVSVQ